MAILPATVLSTDQTLGWTVRGLPIVLYQDLSTSHQVAPVVVSTDSAAYSANVGRILRTSVDQYHNRLILKATLTDAKIQKTLDEFSVESSSGETFVDAADKLAKKIAGDAGPFSTRNEKALVAYAQAFSANGQQQLQLLAEAAKIDPAFGLAQNSLLQVVASQSPELAAQLVQHAQPHRAQFTPVDRARFDLQVAHLNKAPLPELAKQVKDLLALAPGDISALIMLAQLDVADKKVPEAISHLTEAVLMDPSNIQARQLLAGAYLNTHQDEAARKTVEEIRALRPEDITVKRMMGEVEFATGHLTEAGQAYEGVKDAQGLLSAAVCRLLEGDPTHARALFEESTALRGNDPLLPFSRATWLALTGDRAKAVQFLASTKMPNPDFQSVALSQAAIFQVLDGHSAAAQQLADASVKLSQSNIPKSFAIVSSLVAHGSEPAPQFNSRLKSSDLDPRSQVPASAYAYFFAGRYSDSLTQWDTLLQANPGDLRAQIMRAGTLNRMGRTADAIKDAPRLLMPNFGGGDEMAVPAFGELIRVRALAEKQAGRTDLADKLTRAIAAYRW